MFSRLWFIASSITGESYVVRAAFKEAAFDIVASRFADIYGYDESLVKDELTGHELTACGKIGIVDLDSGLVL